MTDSLQPLPDPHPPTPRPAGLGVPEHVWFDAAIEALGRDDAPGPRLAALRMLKQAPRSWDAVMMVGLTTQDPELQLGALEALASHARLDPLRRAGFFRLGKLTVWQPAAREAWESAWRDLGGGPEVASAAAVEVAVGMPAAEVVAGPVEPEGALAEAVAGREALQREAEGLRAEMEALRLACRMAEERLAAQVEATRQLEVALSQPRQEAESGRGELLRALREREAELESLAEVAWRAERDRRRWAVASACGSLVAVGIIAALAVGRAPALASEPNGRVLAAARAEGYRDAVVGIAAEASRLEADGDLRGAAGAWGCIERVAKDADDGLAEHAAVRVRELAGAKVGQARESAVAPSRPAQRAVAPVDPLEGFRAAPVVHSAQVAHLPRAPRTEQRPRRDLAPPAPPRVRRVEAPRAQPLSVPAPARKPTPVKKPVARGSDPVQGDGALIPDDVRAKFD